MFKKPKYKLTPHRLKRYIPDRSNYIERYTGDDFLYGLYLPHIAALKVGHATSNPWHRVRTVVASVAKRYGDDACVDLDYFVSTGGWHDEQRVHERLALLRRSLHRGVMGRTEWFLYQDSAQQWFERRMLEARGQWLPEDEEVRTKCRHKTNPRRKRYPSSTIYVPSD